jgi:uncharacterized protein
VLLEWLFSPLRYIDKENLPRQLRDLVENTADLRAFEYHYDHQACRSLGEITAGTDEGRLKSYCYALRAVLALRWLRDRRTPPPMDLPSLIRGLDLPANLNGELSSLVDRKACAPERGTTSRFAVIDAFIDQVLKRTGGQVNPTGRPAVNARVDKVFASIVLDSMAARGAHKSRIV